MTSAPAPCRFAVAQIPPLPTGPFDVVPLLEAMLAFGDKDALVCGIFPARAVHLRPGRAFAAKAADVVAHIHRALDELLAAHRLWTDWLDDRQGRKLALVVERPC